MRRDDVNELYGVFNKHTASFSSHGESELSKVNSHSNKGYVSFVHITWVTRDSRDLNAIKAIA